MIKYMNENMALEMCKNIRAYADTNQHYYHSAIVMDNVLEIMTKIPRHLFVPDDEIEDAYENRALLIDFKQTISQPYIVALMTSLIMPKSDDVVLEIGTGSGYQAAILSKLVKTVYTLELIPGLALKAEAMFKQLKIDNIICKQKDGLDGYIEGAPYNGIIVTAASKEIPSALLEQLAVNGKMVIPLEDEVGEQNLYLIIKQLNGTYNKIFILPVKFVPLATETNAYSRPNILEH